MTGDPSTSPTQRPVIDDRQLLVEYLRERDVPCPNCGYNLRDLTAAVCPECGSAVSLPSSHRAWTAVDWGAMGLGIGVAESVFILGSSYVVMKGLFDGTLLETLGELWPFAAQIAVQAPLLALWYLNRRWILSRHSFVRVSLVAACWILSAVFVTYGLASC